jgi:polyferredoxin
MSPYLIIDASFKGIISGSFLLFVLQFLSSILVGRIYCGWVCPAAGIQEIIKDYNTKKVNVFNILKWIIWVPWIIAIILVAVKNGGYIKIEPGYQTEFGLYITNV